MGSSQSVVQEQDSTSLIFDLLGVIAFAAAIVYLVYFLIKKCRHVMNKQIDTAVDKRQQQTV